MQASYGWSISSAPAIRFFYVPAGFICYIVACFRCLWATAELQDSCLRGLSFQMGNFCFLPGTAVRNQSCTPPQSILRGNRAKFSINPDIFYNFVAENKTFGSPCYLATKTPANAMYLTKRPWIIDRPWGNGEIFNLPSGPKY